MIPKKTYVILALTIMLSCGKDLSYQNDSLTQFRITTSSFNNDSSTRTRNISNIDFENIECYLFDRNNIFIDIKNIYVPEESTIELGGLKDGEYYMLVLAVKKAADPEGYTISSPTRLNNDKWLTIEDSSKPLNNDYFYTKHLFSVGDGVVSNPNIKLSNICGLVKFKFNWANSYARNSVEEIKIYPTNLSLSNIFLKDGRYQGSEKMEGTLLSDSPDAFAIKLMPPQEGLFEGIVEVKLRSHDGKSVIHNFNFTTQVEPNKRSVVNVNINTPFDDVGTTYIARTDYNDQNFELILIDGEPKEVYNDATQRYFHVNAPIQSKLTEDNKLHLRFYSCVPIDGVQVFAKVEGIEDYVDFAYVEHLPAFADITFDMNKSQEDLVYKTEGGNYIKIATEKFKDPNISFKIKCEAPYWKKIEQIKADWFVKFELFGANPDVPPYTAGNWYAVRPVHCREVIGFMTNIAFMLTLDDFDALVESMQGEYAADGVTIIKDGMTGNDEKLMKDVSTIIPIFTNLVRLNAGIVNFSNVGGLGGGYTFGVPQFAYFGHTSLAGEYGMTLAFHELAHCMGFSHSSGMTGKWVGASTVDWPGKVASFYSNNVARFPVDRNYLNSSENPNRY